MNILFLTNLYPPHVIGGYETLCMEAVTGLAKRGHTVSVLTSTHGYDREFSEGHIHRLLWLEGDLQFYKIKDAWTYPRRNQRNLGHLRRLIETQKPDIVFIWGMWNLSKRLAHEAERLMGPRVVYYLANPWPIGPNQHKRYWELPASSPMRDVAKKALRVPARWLLRDEWKAYPLKFDHAPCCSAALRAQLLEAGVALKDAPVIYEGVELGAYLAQAAQRAYRESESLSLVFVGILAEHKGVHTALEALNQLPPEKKTRVHLTILGKGHEHYVARLQSLMDEYQLAAQVAFHAPIPRNELPEFLGKFDVLLLPSVWKEPLARVMQEGLASGMVVIGSASGGTAETIQPDENGLLFAPGSGEELADRIALLLDQPARRRRLAERGVSTAKQMFDINVMLDNLETYVERVYVESR
ncbi:MAG: glycosyltransferase [Anaerolineales bacterium]|nr:glycosyltransferase [Anaerolineales bacterium]